nr:hypothetical protein [Tanacetum cinerariifolium]
MASFGSSECFERPTSGCLNLGQGCTKRYLELYVPLETLLCSSKHVVTKGRSF